MIRLACCAGIALVVAAFAPPRSTAASVRHPLDALTFEEYGTVVETLKAAGKVNNDTLFGGINLHEPPKAEVLSWKPGAPFRREALAIVKQGRQTFEAIVDVANHKVTSWKEMPGMQPVLIEEEVRGAVKRVKADPQWQAAIRQRGITDLNKVGCDGDSPGFFDTPEEKGRRLMRIHCTVPRSFADGGSFPVEGLIAVWDADEEKIVRLIDTGPLPVPSTHETAVIPPRDVPGPLTVQQPAHGFRNDGNEVSWQNWHFHFRIDAKAGVVVTNVSYHDGGKERSILYEGSLAEIFVPYMDPAEGWYHTTFIDMGEGNTWGGVASTLKPGADCPDNAVYFDSVIPTAHGKPLKRPRTACLFEREAGEFAWRHSQGGFLTNSRRQRDLVLRMITTFGNYDYAVDWTFQQNGSIRIGVGATGSVEVKGVRSRTVAEDSNGNDGRYGHFVADNTVAVNHDHFFNFRLDLDVDGTNNSFVKEEMKTKRLPEDNPRKSVWVAEQQVAKTEGDAQLTMMMEHPALWRVINPNVKGPLGYPVGYEIAGGHNAVSLMVDSDWPQQRAGFIRHNLWVTPYREDERYPAGDYPTQSHGGDGLPSWTKDNRPIENTDIVVWYTLGFHHVPRPEDWPIMPTAWHEFELRPFDFFARNPAVDLPKEH